MTAGYEAFTPPTACPPRERGGLDPPPAYIHNSPLSGLESELELESHYNSQGGRERLVRKHPNTHPHPPLIGTHHRQRGGGLWAQPAVFFFQPAETETGSPQPGGGVVKKGSNHYHPDGRRPPCGTTSPSPSSGDRPPPSAPSSTRGASLSTSPTSPRPRRSLFLFGAPHIAQSYKSPFRILQFLKKSTNTKPFY